jgi:hypothetical protein
MPLPPSLTLQHLHLLWSILSSDSFLNVPIHVSLASSITVCRWKNTRMHGLEGDRSYAGPANMFLPATTKD